MANLLPVLGSIGSKVIGSLIASLLTEKVIMKLIIILVDKLVKSSKNQLDDELWAPMRAALQKEEK